MSDLSQPKYHAEYLKLLQRRRLYSGVIFAVFALLMISGFYIANGRNAGGFWDGLPNIFDFPAAIVKDTIPRLDLLPSYFVEYFPSLLETINIAAVSTLLGAMLGMVLSLLSTRGLALWPALIPIFRRLMDVLRAVPEIVVALVLIYMLGAGPVPAVIAIAFHSSGSLGKLFSEVNENADLKPIEGLTSTGATWSKRMVLGVFPQVAPNYLSYGLMRFEINVRASAILGFVGAGGVGYDLKNTMSFGIGKFDEAAAIFILLFLTIVFFDQASSYLRGKLTHGGH